MASPTPKPLEAVEQRTFRAALDCHYLLSLPESFAEDTLLVVALHGYGSNPQVMLTLTRGMLGPKHAIAAVEGPYGFFLSQAPDSEVGYGWISRAHAAESVRLHHDMLLHVLGEAGQQCGIGPGRRVLAGFSQPVGLNYRFMATHPRAVRGVVGICGGLPRDWEAGAYQNTAASVLHLARREDEFYPPQKTQAYRERLLLRASDVEFHLLDGGHRFPSKAGPIVERWIERVWGRQELGVRS